MIIAELSKLLDEIKATREKMYPPGWEYDMLFPPIEKIRKIAGRKPAIEQRLLPLNGANVKPHLLSTPWLL